MESVSNRVGTELGFGARSSGEKNKDQNLQSHPETLHAEKNLILTRFTYKLALANDKLEMQNASCNLHMNGELECGCFLHDVQKVS